MTGSLNPPPSAAPPADAGSATPLAPARSTDRLERHVPLPHLAIGVFVLAVSLMLAAGALMLPADKGYSIVGTFAFPLAVALFMGAMGAGLVWQALTGGFRLLAEAEEPAAGSRAERIGAAAWVSGGLLIDAFLIDHVGFVLASTLLFAAAARGFGSRRWPTNLALGLAIAWPVYLGFTLGLGLSLPGLAKPWF